MFKLSRRRVIILILLLLFSRTLWFALRHKTRTHPEVRGEALSHVVVFAASKMEAGTVKDLMTPAHQGTGSSKAITGRIGANEIGLFITGIGPKKAEASARTVLLSGRAVELGDTTTSRRPDAVLVIGLCGSLASSIDEGEVVLYTDCLSVGNGRPGSRVQLHSLTASMTCLVREE